MENPDTAALTLMEVSPSSADALSAWLARRASATMNEALVGDRSGDTKAAVYRHLWLPDNLLKPGRVQIDTLAFRVLLRVASAFWARLRTRNYGKK